MPPVNFTTTPALAGVPGPLFVTVTALSYDAPAATLPGDVIVTERSFAATTCSDPVAVCGDFKTSELVSVALNVKTVPGAVDAGIRTLAYSVALASTVLRDGMVQTTTPLLPAAGAVH